MSPSLLDLSLPERFAPDQWYRRSGDHHAVLGRLCGTGSRWTELASTAMLLNACTARVAERRRHLELGARDQLVLITGRSVRALDLPGSRPAQRPLGWAPWPQWISYDGARPWILAHRGGSLVAIARADGRCVPLADAGARLEAVAISEDGARAFVVERGETQGRVITIAAADLVAGSGMPGRDLDDQALARAARPGGVGELCRIAEAEADLAFARLSGDGARLLVVNRLGYTACYDATSGDRLWQRRGFLPLTGCFHPSRPIFAAWGLEDGYSIDLLELDTGRSIGRLYPLQWGGLEGQIPVMRFLDDGARLAIAHARLLYTYDLFAAGPGEPVPDATDVEAVMARLLRQTGCAVDDTGRITWLAEPME